jgi:hypothetical protein
MAGVPIQISEGARQKMREAIWSRVKITILVGSFFLPVFAEVWRQHVEARAMESRYLTPLPLSPTERVIADANASATDPSDD